MDTFWTIAIALTGVLTTSGICGLVKFFVTRHDQKKKDKKSLQKTTIEQFHLIADKLNDISNNIDKLEMHSCRTQLMLLMNSYPKKVDEILKVGYKYFVQLNGDEYMTGLFMDWIMQQQLEKPEWFNSNK